jgi:hypothetical protein
VALDGRARIAIKRRADRIRQLGEIDRFGVKHSVAIRKVMHGTSLEHQIVKWKSASSLRGAQATKQSSKPFNPPELLRGAGPVGLR